MARCNVFVKNSIMNKLKLAAFFLFAYLFQTSSAQSKLPQKIVLYSGKGGTGQFVSLVETGETNLAKKNFDNKAQSACVTGIWIFYEHPDYNKGYPGLVEYLHGVDNFCVNLMNTGLKTSSVKFAGFPKSGDANTLTLYAEEFFQDLDEYTYVDLPTLKLDLKAKSLIITGASPWTVYMGQNFQGASVCIMNAKSANFLPTFLPTFSSVGIAGNSIRSVRIGCHSPHRVTVP